MSKKHKQHRAAGSGMAAESAHAGGTKIQGGAHAAKHFEIPDELLHAPKQTSKLRFALMILLVIVLLLIFAIPSGLRGLSSWRDRGVPAAFSWDSPVHGKVEVNELDLQLAYRDFSQAFQVDFMAARDLGITEKFDARGTARLLVIDQLAQDSGVTITDTDLRDHLKGYLEGMRMTVDDYKRRVQQFGFDAAKLEETIRRALRIGRFLRIAGYASAVPDPAEIEKMWKREHVEFAFEYAALAPEEMKETARAALPDEAGLRAWFDGLDDAAKKELETPEKRRADFAVFKSIEETPAAALVAAFPPEPPAEGQEPPSAEQLAQDYYNRVFHRRFMKLVDDTAEDGHFHHDHDQPARTEFQPFEEVKDQCLAEAPVYFALQRWLQALQGRKAAGETIDLAAEAAQYGLSYRALETPLTREELTADPELDDSQIASAVFEAAPDGGFHFVPVATKNALVISRTSERVEPVLPPFEEVYDQVAEKWIVPKAEELALARLQSVWIGFEQFEPAPEEEPMPIQPENKVHRRATADRFNQGLANAMLVLEKRDFFDRGAPANTDPDFEKPAHKYLQTRFDLYQMEEGEIAEPQLARDKSAAYIVRVAGRREVPIDRMTPAQYERYKTNARSIAIDEMAMKFDLAFLEKNYGLVLKKPQEEEAGAAADAGGAGAASETQGGETKSESSVPPEAPSAPADQPDDAAEQPDVPADQPSDHPSSQEAPAETQEPAGEAPK